MKYPIYKHIMEKLLLCKSEIIFNKKLVLTWSKITILLDNA